MRARAWLWGCGWCLAAALGCGDDFEPPREDGGPHSVGAGSDAGDAGPIVWMPKDAGSAGSSGRAGSSGSAGSAGSDARMCARPRQPLPLVLLPRCSASTRDCVESCTGSADPSMCRDSCVDADTTPPDAMYGVDCSGCIYLQLFACIDRAKCHQGVADVFCCIEEQCPAGSPEGCGEQRCGTELNAALTCGYYADMECLNFLGSSIGGCFPAGGGDADAGSP